MRDMWPAGVPEEAILIAINNGRGTKLFMRDLAPFANMLGLSRPEQKTADPSPVSKTEEVVTPLVTSSSIEPVIMLSSVEPVECAAPEPPVFRPKSTVPVAPPNLGPPRLAKALELPPPMAVSHEPIEADATTIRATADMWGITFRGIVDLWAVNKAAEKRGARPFKLVQTEEKTKMRNCLHCGQAFKSNGPYNRVCERCGPTVNRNDPGPNL